MRLIRDLRLLGERTYKFIYPSNLIIHMIMQVQNAKVNCMHMGLDTLKPQCHVQRQ